MKFKNIGLMLNAIAISAAGQRALFLDKVRAGKIKLRQLLPNDITPRKYQDHSRYKPHDGERKAAREHRHAQRWVW